jgi:hypothetical protein
MIDIKALQDRLARARADLAADRKAHLEKREALRRTQASLQTAARTADAARKKVLEEQQQVLTAKAATTAAAKSEAAAAIKAGLGSLIALGEPDALAGSLADRHPILLYPLRLETRFKKGPSKTTGALTDQLWIRIYPDDCQIETFTEILTESELRDAKAFWIATWAAGGVEAQERAAWRSLVSAHGTGRSSWLVNHFLPDNQNARPVKAGQDDLLLVIASDSRLTAAHEAAVLVFWKAWWIAGDDGAARNAALVVLRSAVGGNELATYIQQSVVPPNIGDRPPAGKRRDQIQVSAVFIRFPADDSIPLSTSSWLQAPAARTLPDRFMVLGFRDGAQVLRVVLEHAVPDELHVGPDPSLPEDEQMKHAAGDLTVNAELRWMTDFDEAIANGLGEKIDISATDAAAGYDELLVLGIRYSSDAATGAVEVEKLLTNHLFSSNGLRILAQGTPTNNTEGSNAGYHSLDDADLSFDIVFKHQEAFVETIDEFAKADGQHLAEGLGIASGFLKQLPNAAAHDQAEARAMNIALWPATWGYFLEEMMAPVVSAADVTATREFFTRFVSGRGPLPAIRIGRQPYGLLPATAFSKLSFPGRSDDYLNRLHGLLSTLDADWDSLSDNVPTVSQAGDPHQRLLDILGLHAGSIEFYQRYAQSLDQMYNVLLLKHGEPWGRVFATAQQRMRAGMLAAAELPAGSQPPILEKYFYDRASLLMGDVVDDLPLSESRPVRPYTADKKNYLTWLMNSSLETIRLEDFGGEAAPTSLLYLWLRHALMLAYWDGGLKLHEAVGLPTSRQEPPFVHVQDGAASESKWKPLYQSVAAISGPGRVTVADYISRSDVIDSRAELSNLKAVKDALARLESTPTARLERLFVEHVDCCHYRLDAWKNGLIAARLWEMRGREAGSIGLYTGGYGWLEHVRSEQKPLTPVELSPELRGVFQKPGDPAPMRDDSNAGFIHAPSISQATAAAVLKSAYLSASGPGAAEAYSIDLSSQRVRKALGILEGIRNGQSLSALLGYQFERGLHDKHALAEVDQFIYPLRLKFPLVANRMKDTVSPSGTSIQSIEARNVLDGLSLVNHLKANAAAGYPFDLADILPPAATSAGTAIAAELAGLLDTNDAVADVVLAESVYQVVQGNFDRAAANSDALSQGGHPPEIEVVKTMRTGRAITERFAVHFDTTVDPATSPEPGLAISPRARAEASVNYWLHQILPRPKDISCRVTVTSHVDGSESAVFVTPFRLGLQPIDLLFVTSNDSEQAMTDLDDRIWRHVWYAAHKHPLDDFKIEYMVPEVDGGISFFEAGALVRSLRTVLLKSRFLKPEQLALTQEGRSGSGDFDDGKLQIRIAKARTDLLAHLSDLNALTNVNNADGIDAFVKKAADSLVAVSLFGVPQTSPGYLFSELKSIFAALRTKIRAVLTRWDQRIAMYDNLLATFGTAATDDERLDLLARMETTVSPVATSPRPTNVVSYQANVASRRTALDQLYTKLKAHQVTPTAALEAFMTALLPDVQQIGDFDSVPFDPEKTNDVAAEETRIRRLREEARQKLKQLADDIVARGNKVTSLLADAAAKTAPAEKVEVMLTAAKQVLGEDLLLLPWFRLTKDQGDELALAVADSSQLLEYQRNTLENRFPVDDWLYGLARVKEKMFHWENVTFLTEALGNANTPALTPLQLPYQPADSWLAMEFPPAYRIETEKLLYTAHFARPFDKTALQTGILVDEWTEVIPGKDEATGLSFHYDQPNTEPPQVMLLLVPPQLEGKWNWEDIVAGVRETFDMARKRAVEPAQIDHGPYAQFLPSTLMAVTLHPVTIATNLAVSNNVYDDLAKRS